MQRFAEFWPHYLREHSRVGTRLLHYFGTIAATGAAVYLIATGRWSWAPLAFVPGYACAWFGHFFIERNTPTTFKHPLWSFIADYRMLGLMLIGRLKGELAKAAQSD